MIIRATNCCTVNCQLSPLWETLSLLERRGVCTVPALALPLLSRQTAPAFRQLFPSASCREGLQLRFFFFFFDTYLSCTWEIEIKRAGCTASIMCINIVMGQGVPEMLRSSSHPVLSPQRCSGTFTPRSTEPSPEVSPMLQSTFDFQAGDDSCPIGSRSDHTQ